MNKWLFDERTKVLNNRRMSKRVSRSASTGQFVVETRRARVVSAAGEAGLLAGERSSIGARVPKPLLEAARLKTGLTSTTEIVEYALAKVALEDDFGPRLLARRGRVSKDLDLDV